MNTILAVIPAAISAIVGFGLSHLVVKKISTSSKFQKALSFVIFISIGVGITGMMNEFLASLFIGGAIKTDKIVMFVFSNILVLPIFLYFLIFLAKKFQAQDINATDEVVDVKKNSGSETNQFSVNLNKTTLVIGSVVFLVAVLFFASGGINKSDKSFDFKQCTSCTNDDCKENLNQKGFKVTLNQVLVFLKTKEGVDRIVSYPDVEKMKCTVLPEKNFAFDCNSFEHDSGFITEKLIAFDGKDKYVNSFTQKLIGGNPRGIEMITRCTVN